jgi:hypothetical protein
LASRVWVAQSREKRNSAEAEPASAATSVANAAVFNTYLKSAINAGRLNKGMGVFSPIHLPESDLQKTF